MNLLNEILEHNENFVESQQYTKFKTSKFPDKKVTIVTCMDTRLIELLPQALGFKNGDAKIIKNAGGIVMHPFATAMRSILITIYEFEVEDVLIIGHENCGMACLDKSYVIDKMVSSGISHDTISLLKNSGIDVASWLSGFECIDESVRSSVELVRKHPLVHKNVRVTGLVINPETGKLRVIE